MWEDYRLNYSTPQPETQSIQLDGRALDMIWVPNIFFPHEKKGKKHEMTQSNIRLQIYENGTVLFSQR